MLASCLILCQNHITVIRTLQPSRAGREFRQTPLSPAPGDGSSPLPGDYSCKSAATCENVAAFRVHL
jgi:hypothetical protein